MKLIVRLLLAVAVLGAVQSPLVGIASAATSYEHQLVGLVNEERTERGLEPLKVDTGVRGVARDWTDSMIAGSKGCPDGLAHNKRYAEQVPEGWTRVGENVACASSVASVHKVLMKSKTHRSNVLGNFTEVGIGVSVDEEGSVWVTQIFATYGK